MRSKCRASQRHVMTSHPFSKWDKFHYLYPLVIWWSMICRIANSVYNKITMKRINWNWICPMSRLIFLGHISGITYTCNCMLWKFCEQLEAFFFFFLQICRLCAFFVFLRFDNQFSSHIHFHVFCWFFFYRVLFLYLEIPDSDLNNKSLLWKTIKWLQYFALCFSFHVFPIGINFHCCCI